MIEPLNSRHRPTKSHSLGVILTSRVPISLRISSMGSHFHILIHIFNFVWAICKIADIGSSADMLCAMKLAIHERLVCKLEVVVHNLTWLINFLEVFCFGLDKNILIVHWSLFQLKHTFSCGAGEAGAHPMRS